MPFRLRLPAPVVLLQPGRSLFLFSTALILLSLLRAGQKLSAFKLAHWHFSYEFEFVKRGLPGELLRLAGLAPTHATVWLVSNLLLVCVVVALLRHFVRPARLQPRSPGLWLFFLFAATSPATLAHFSWDVGRYDGIGLLCALGCLSLLERTRGVPLLLSITTLLTLALLCHEGAILVYGPLIYVCWAYKNREQGRSQVFLFSSLALLSLPLFFLATAGPIQTMSFPQFSSLLEARHGGPLPRSALWVPFESLQGTIAQTLAVFFEPRNLSRQLLLLLVAALPIGWLLSNTYRRIRRRSPEAESSRNKWVLLAALLGPLALFPLGIDSRRWWALALTNLFLVTARLCEKPEFRQALAGVFFERRRLVWLLLAAHLVYGPIEA